VAFLPEKLSLAGKKKSFYSMEMAPFYDVQWSTIGRFRLAEEKICYFFNGTWMEFFQIPKQQERRSSLTIGDASVPGSWNL
jgi:hypothetical protein